MKQFRTILNFELKNYFKNKVFVGVTIFLVALIAVVMFFPRLSASFQSDEVETPVSEKTSVMLVAADNEENAAMVQEVFASAFPEYDVQIAEGGLEAMKSQITSGEAECAVALDSLTSYTYYVNNLSMYDETPNRIDAALQSMYRVLMAEML